MSARVMEPAIAAVKTWTVNPATFNGKKLDAKLIAEDLVTAREQLLTDGH